MTIHYGLHMSYVSSVLSSALRDSFSGNQGRDNWVGIPSIPLSLREYCGGSPSVI